MRPDPVLQFRLGLTAIGLVLLVALAAAFAPRLLDRRTEAEAVFSNVAELAEGAKVMDRGFAIGRVARIEQRLTERRFIVYLRLDPKWQPENPHALGLVVEEPNPLRPATLNVVSADDCPEPSKLDPTITTMQLRGCGHHPSMIELTLITLNVTKETVQRVNAILEVLAPAGKRPGAPSNAGALMTRLDTTMKNIQVVSESARTMLDSKHQRKLDNIIDNLALTSHEASATAKGAHGLVQTNSKSIGSSISDVRYILAVTASQMAAITADLQASTANLKEITAQLRDDPASALRRKALGDPTIAHKRR